VKMITESGWN